MLFSKASRFPFRSIQVKPKHVLEFYIFIMTFFFVLPMLLQDKFYSPYFSMPARDESFVILARDKNKQRLQQAKEHIANIIPQMPKIIPFDQLQEEGFQYDLVIAVLTTIRQEREGEQLGYLTQTISKLQSEIDKGKKNNLTLFKSSLLFICNVDYQPYGHKEAMGFFKKFHTVEKYASFNPNHDQTITNVYEKTKQDHSFCLLEATRFNPKYVLMIEDDTLPVDNFAQSLEHTLNQLATRGHGHDYNHDHHSKGTLPWFSLKLYYPEKWRGYSFNLPHIFELFSIGILGGTLYVLVVKLLSAIMICLFQKKYTFSKEKNHYGVDPCKSLWNYRDFIIGSIYCILLTFSIGRHYVNNVRHLHPVLYRIFPAPECSTAAVLYKGNVIHSMIDHLLKTNCTEDLPIDIVIDKYADQNHFLRYMIEPNLVEHIGMYSVIRPYLVKRAAQYVE